MYKGMHCPPHRPPSSFFCGWGWKGVVVALVVTFHQTDAIRGKRVLILNAQSDAKDISG